LKPPDIPSDPKIQTVDHILLETRIIAALVIPFLVLAFLILYLYPQESARRFAWPIDPGLLAMYIGAGYLGGAYLFAHTLLGRAWHRVAAGFWPVTTFATSMLLITLLHWDQVDIHHFPFQLWLILYVVTPVLIPVIWLRNRPQDPLVLAVGDKRVPRLSRQIMGLIGLIFCLLAVIGFLFPNWLMGIWIWPLTVLSAQLLSGWHALLGVGGLVISREERWSGWRVPLESIGLWQLLVLIAAMMNPEDFNGGTAVNWYTISVIVILAGMVGIYLLMARQPTE